MSIVVLALGTVFSLIFLILLFMGGKYDYMIEPLDSDIYPLKFFYSAGFALQNTKLFRLRGKLGGRRRCTTGRSLASFTLAPSGPRCCHTYWRAYRCCF